MKIDWTEYRVKLVSAGRTRTPPGWSLDRKWSLRLKDMDLWFVWAGRGGMVIDEVHKIDLHPGVCVWARPGSIYEAWHDPKQRLGVSYNHFDLLNRAGKIRPTTMPLPPQWHEVADVSFVEASMRRITDLSIGSKIIGGLPAGSDAVPVSNPNHPGIAPATQILTGLLMDMDRYTSLEQVQYSGTKQHHHLMVHKIAAEIVESPQEQYSVAKLSRKAGYSPDHFSRVFKEILSMSPQEYVVQARINRARQLLMESSLSISQIAEALNYRDVFFFSRQFKSKTGHSPYAFRAAQS